MKVTFSNGVEINAFNVTENIDPNQPVLLLLIRSNEQLDINATYHQISDGIDDIVVTEDNGDEIEFTGYTKIASIQNIINESGFEANITLSKSSTIE